MKRPVWMVEWKIASIFNPAKATHMPHDHGGPWWASENHPYIVSIQEPRGWGVGEIRSFNYLWIFLRPHL